MKYSDVIKAKMIDEEWGQYAEDAYVGGGMAKMGYQILKLYVGFALLIVWLILFIIRKVKENLAKDAETEAASKEQSAANAVEEQNWEKLREINRNSETSE